MHIMIFDVPAESGGALSMLREVYEEALANEDKTIKWTFVVSKPDLKETENIKVLRFPWIKRSWIHRLYFDNFVAPKIVKRNKVDYVLSLQNITVPSVNCGQVLYVHQSLPFVDHKFSFRENKKLWIYQNVIGKKIIKSIQKADYTIVQAEWMKRACINKAGIRNEIIEVIPPKVKVEVNKSFKPTNESLSTFFYPANGMKYKNHKVIVEAASSLKKTTVKKHEIIFTLTGNENEYISSLYERVKKEKLPIKFCGKMSKKEVFEMYTRSVLIFPSFIETFGLPLLESRNHGGIILASDTPFAHEILETYQNSYYFQYEDYRKLSELMTDILTSKILHNNTEKGMNGDGEKVKSLISFLIKCAE